MILHYSEEQERKDEENINREKMVNCYSKGIEIKRRMQNAKKHYVSYSGGKDSTAMLLRLIELDYQIDEIVFADTGFEFPELYDYVKRIEKYINRKITILDPKDTWDKWFYGKSTRGKSKGKVRGYPLRYYSCWFTRESKVNPLQKYMVDAKVIYVGIAHDEKRRYSKDDFIKNPLVEWGWTEQDCVNYLNKKGLLNPLYKNFNRLGCFHCQKQSEFSLYILWKNYPKLWKKTVEMDEKSILVSGHGMKEKPLSEYHDKFRNGYQPKNLPKYQCIGCDGVASAFNIRQEKLENYVKVTIH